MSSIPKKYSELDFHDDTLIKIAVLPSVNETNTNRLEINLERHWENKRRKLTFTDIANISLNLDIDVLNDNSPNNTSGVSFSAESEDLIRIITDQKSKWDVEYDKSLNEPIETKMKNIGKYALYKLQFYGGALEVIAKGYEIHDI